jgi:hypothetical protein
MAASADGAGEAGLIETMSSELEALRVAVAMSTGTGSRAMTHVSALGQELASLRGAIEQSKTDAALTEDSNRRVIEALHLQLEALASQVCVLHSEHSTRRK